MCTVTIVPHARGVRLTCNRDERRTRPAALPPEIHDIAGLRAIFPIDPLGGGTWIGVNDAGLAVVLLNVTRISRAVTPRRGRTRGLIVRELLSCRTLPEVVATVRRLDPLSFEPFQVVAVHDGRVVLATTDETARLRIRCRTLESPLLLTSSSLGDERVRAPRRRLFDRLVVRSRAGWLQGQARFHRHRWAARPEISIRMERRDAVTVSRTILDMARHECRLSYQAPPGSDARTNGVRRCLSLR